MAFLNSLNTLGSALTAQRLRTDIAAQNISNQNNVASSPEEAYKRKQVVFETKPMTFDDALTQAQGGGVIVKQIVDLDEDPIPVYDPSNPLCDENGYVYKANVNASEEMVDLMNATRSYETTITAISVIKAMAAKALEIGKQ